MNYPFKINTFSVCHNIPTPPTWFKINTFSVCHNVPSPPKWLKKQLPFFISSNYVQTLGAVVPNCVNTLGDGVPNWLFLARGHKLHLSQCDQFTPLCDDNKNITTKKAKLSVVSVQDSQQIRHEKACRWPDSLQLIFMEMWQFWIYLGNF